jgi:diguanylate cyclase (GGDEF)-like protein/PAS domain S-box-containing protein
MDVNQEQATIWVIDDVPGNLKVVFRYLTRHGFRVLISEDPQEALEKIPFDPPDLILLDIMMPGIDGIEVCRRLKKESVSAEIPVIFMTAMTDTASKVEGFQVGAVDYITKPVQNAELMARISTHLRLEQMRRTLERQHQEQQVILDNSPVGIAFLDAAEMFQRINAKMEDIFGVNSRDLRGQSIAALFDSPLNHWRYVSRGLRAANREGVYACECELRHRQGLAVWCRVLFQAVARDDYAQGFILTVEDITERRQNDAKMRLASTVMETISEGIMVTDAKGVILDVNQAFTDITGYTGEEAIGQTPRLFKSDTQSLEFYQAMWRNLEKHGIWRGEIWNKHKNGKIFPEYLSITAIAHRPSEPRRYVAIFHDISQRKEYEALIERQANYDTLTELPNRFLFMNRLALSIEQANQQHSAIALMFIDLDMFKEVNDTLGHKAGDELLQIAARRLLNCVRESDTVARLGGDEFTVILPNVHLIKHVEVVAQKLLQQLITPFELSAQTVQISGSIGIALYPGDAHDVESFIQHADAAMYQAKHAGRNQYHFYCEQ